MGAQPHQQFRLGYPSIDLFQVVSGGSTDCAVFSGNGFCPYSICSGLASSLVRCYCQSSVKNLVTHIYEWNVASIKLFLTPTRYTSISAFDHPRPLPIGLFVTPSRPSIIAVLQNKPASLKVLSLGHIPIGHRNTSSTIFVNPAASI